MQGPARPPGLPLATPFAISSLPFSGKEGKGSRRLGLESPRTEEGRRAPHRQEACLTGRSPGHRGLQASGLVMVTSGPLFRALCPGPQCLCWIPKPEDFVSVPSLEDAAQLTSASRLFSPQPSEAYGSLTLSQVSMGFGGFPWMSPLYPTVLNVRMSLLGSLTPRRTAWLACHPVVRPHAQPGSGRHRRSNAVSACVEGRARAGHLTFVEGPAGGRGSDSQLPRCPTPAARGSREASLGPEGRSLQTRRVSQGGEGAPAAALAS